jgi:hypothetical protein
MFVVDFRWFDERGHVSVNFFKGSCSLCQSPEYLCQALIINPFGGGCSSDYTSSWIILRNFLLHQLSICYFYSKSRAFIVWEHPVYSLRRMLLCSGMGHRFVCQEVVERTVTERADQRICINAPAHSTSLVQDFLDKTSHHPGVSAPL